MTHSEKRARKSVWRVFGHLLGLLMLALIIATVAAIIRSPVPFGVPGEKPVRLYRPGFEQQAQDQPIMVKAPGSGPLAAFFGSRVPLPPLPGIPRDALETAQVTPVGLKDRGQDDPIPVWEVVFDSNTSEAVGGQNIYLVKIENTAGGQVVPTCDMDRMFVDSQGATDISAAVYGYRYVSKGQDEAALLAIDLDDDGYPDLPFGSIFTGEFIATDDVNPADLAAFTTAYGVPFSPSSGETTGPGQLYAFISNAGVIIDPTACTAKCGDGIVDSPESCDPDTGHNSSSGTANAPSSLCTDTCEDSSCGDSVVNSAAGEECDDGNDNSHDSCVSCDTAECGDGYVSSLESCDDGNTSDGDGCSASCTVEYGFLCTNRDGDLEVSDWPESLCGTSCGDGIAAGFEYCDEGGANGTSGACCDSECNVRSSSYVCRSAAGVCDVDDMCDGLSAICPSDAKQSSSYECNPASGVCDVSEYCDGLNNDCPIDAVAGSSSSCRASTDGEECDLTEYCDGSSKSCPTEDYTNDFDDCSEDGNECTDDYCESGVCVHPNLDDFTDCTEQDGNECTEFACISGSCIDSSVIDGTSCGDLINDWCYAGICEVCGNGQRESGEGCDDGNQSSSDGCSATCTIDSGWSCSTDLGLLSVCTPNCAVGSACTDTDNNECTVAVCDQVGQCQQSSAGLNWSAYASSGASCSDDGEWCTYDQCDGMGGCTHNVLVANGTPCPTTFGGSSISNGYCYNGVCDNYCGDGFTDPWEQCDLGGSNGAMDSCCSSTCSYVSSSQICRSAAGVCDMAEYCTGSSASCPSDMYDTMSECRSSAGTCDPADYCNGTGPNCPSNESGFSSTAGMSCDDGDANDCHYGLCEFGACETGNNYDPNGTQCGDNDWCYNGSCFTCGNGSLDPGEECDAGGLNGTSTSCCDSVCLFKTSAEVCHDGNDATCDPDTYCSGSSADCPWSGYNSVSCSTEDMNECTDGQCSSGVCMAVNNSSACSDSDGNACTSGQCSGGSCLPQPSSEGSPCPGGYCTTGSSSSGGVPYCFPVPL